MSQKISSCILHLSSYLKTDTFQLLNNGIMDKVTFLYSMYSKVRTTSVQTHFLKPMNSYTHPNLSFSVTKIKLSSINGQTHIPKRQFFSCSPQALFFLVSSSLTLIHLCTIFYKNNKSTIYYRFTYAMYYLLSTIDLFIYLFIDFRFIQSNLIWKYLFTHLAKLIRLFLGHFGLKEKDTFPFKDFTFHKEGRHSTFGSNSHISN